MTCDARLLSNELNPVVFLDIAVGPEKVGRVIIELFNDHVPRTAENFRALCTGEKGEGTRAAKLHYKGSFFHNAISQLMVLGGDIVKFDGSAGESIYGPHFEDENFLLKHDSPGILSMEKPEAKPNTNSSQFIITTKPAKHLDCINVVFGKVIKGLGVVKEISKEPEILVQKICIIDCGELKKGESWGLEEEDGTKDIYTPWPEDLDYYCYFDKLTHANLETVIEHIKESGNHYFRQKNFADAGRKYKKALRYYSWMRKQDMLDTFYTSLTNLKLVLLLNLSAVHLEQNQNSSALKLCNDVLLMDELNIKALYRRGQAFLSMRKYKLALQDFSELLEMSPSKEVLMEMRKIVRLALPLSVMDVD
ncbi:PREDICTED: peptidyl-prolyl cis-trans isomerase D [Vollenhovia emeryi]|uniref:peptidyl-prolyl cis-trans isomerase D n=1 Tax=Vollenhovia emeryi TaxID=411798 RepID=UPI0005F58C93|nr:PREDICTED: peptidyl-prolyl cis-trans isomerase D [Vollenhovia emeryi]XP_011880006.1 PREDICTED: peptidyl-prolyl cis-trans isomerase D [Vollenhovia emeryi]